MSENVELEQLAIHGGVAVFPDGPPEWPPELTEVNQMVLEALKENAWGKYHARFTMELIEKLGSSFQSSHVHLTSSGTIAVELALRGLGINPGDEVMMAGYDFPGNFRAIEAVNAIPVLVDVAENGWTLGATSLNETLEQLLDRAKSPATKAIIVSHMHGQLAPMQQLVKWAELNSVKVIEDACQCPTAMIMGQPAGSFGDIGVLSFGGSKLLSSGRGGAILTNNDSIAQRILIFSERGNDAFPLSQLQAAALIPQLSSIQQHNQTRANRFSRLKAQLEDCRILSAGDINSQGIVYKVPLLIADACSVPRESLIAAFQAEGIAIDSGFRGFVNRSARRCKKIGSLKNSSIAAERTLLLHHPILLESDETIDRLAAGIKKVIFRLLSF